MTTISLDTLATVQFSLFWHEDGVSHEDRLYAQNVNLWRDYFPAGLGDVLNGLNSGSVIRVPLEPGKHIPARDSGKIVQIPRSAFSPSTHDIAPILGRFYPQGVVRGLPGVFPQNILPLRIVDINTTSLTVDLNHPLAGVEASLELMPMDVWPKTAEFGGQSQDWICALLDGPGLKRQSTKRTDFGLDHPLDKPLGARDDVFYATPRKVAHVDSQSRARIRAVYERLLPGRPRILDLMAGWQSHLPDGVLATGLGMNAEEMRDNPALFEIVVHDLNSDPILPFAAHSFDAVICSLSVEYLTRPLEIFREITRVLKSGSLCIVVFSHRWFPDQAVRIWTELHEFERVALVVDYFRRTDGFSTISTLSDRGWPRPMDARDRYYPMIQHSDPVHAVWAWTS